MSETMARLWAGVFWVVFAIAMVANGLVNAGIIGQLTIAEISATHPVYLTPPGFAFQVWILIYAWIAVWGVVQSLPASIADPSFEPLRPLATLAFVFNAAWLIIFAHQLFWTALVVIVMYLGTVYALVALIRVNTVKALANITQPGVWRMLIGQHCFSANAAWLTAATLLQFEINLLEVGWFPTIDFSVALMTVAAMLAIAVGFELVDPAWVGVTAWALLTIGANQMGFGRSSTDWGCLSSICPSCEAFPQEICMNDKQPPLGWNSTCASFDSNSTESSGCVLQTSTGIVIGTITFTSFVIAGFVAGFIRALVEVLLSRGSPPATSSSAVAP